MGDTEKRCLLAICLRSRLSRISTCKLRRICNFALAMLRKVLGTLKVFLPHLGMSDNPKMGLLRAAASESTPGPAVIRTQILAVPAPLTQPAKCGCCPHARIRQYGRQLRFSPHRSRDRSVHAQNLEHGPKVPRRRWTRFRFRDGITIRNRKDSARAKRTCPPSR